MEEISRSSTEDPAALASKYSRVVLLWSIALILTLFGAVLDLSLQEINTTLYKKYLEDSETVVPKLALLRVVSWGIELLYSVFHISVYIFIVQIPRSITVSIQNHPAILRQTIVVFTFAYTVPNLAGIWIERMNGRSRSNAIIPMVRFIFIVGMGIAVLVTD
jgi:hypothetical protein